MISKFKTYPFFVLLIPLFYLLHGYLYYFGLIPLKEALLLLFFYELITAALYFALWLFYRKNAQKAGVVTGCLQIVFFFFGAYHDFLLKYAPVISHYSVLITLIFLLLAVLAWLVKNSFRAGKLSAWLNLLFFIYLLVDGVQLAIKYVQPPANKFSVNKEKANVRISTNQNNPDIYFLIFDEYASSLSLQENYGYKNKLDSNLAQKGFHLMPASFSNYNYTAPSIASILNMSFINGLYDSSELTIKDMNYCLDLIRDNELIHLLSSKGYSIINCSDFELLNHPVDIYNQLPVKTRLITDNTLWAKLKRDVLGNIKWRPLANFIAKATLHEPLENNRQLLNMINENSHKKNNNPAFVFAHFYMPHDPFLYDKNNKLREPALFLSDASHPEAPYLDYLDHVNMEMMKLIDTIQVNTANKAAIIVMGDHGFRGRHIEENKHLNYQNLNAVYLPARNYQLFYDSISGVNQFRVICNTLFNQSLPLLKDSTIFLTGKEHLIR